MSGTATGTSYGTKAVRCLILMLGLVATQCVLYGPALLGRTVLLPVDILWRNMTDYVSPEQLGRISPQNRILSDAVYVFEPNRRFMVEELREGRLPLWNPYIFCGTPFLTNLFSPFHWPYLATGSPYSLAWIEMLKALVAGTGAYLFFRNVLHVGFWPATIGAWCFPLTGFLVLWATFPPLGNVIVWLPWLLWCTDRTVRGPGVAGICGLSIVTALVLVEGIFGPAAQLLLFSGAMFVWGLLDRCGVKGICMRQGMGAIVRTGAGWLLGLLLSAPQTLPALEYLATSHRVQTRMRGEAEALGNGATAVLPVLFPYFFGDNTYGARYIGEGTQARMESSSSGYAGLLMALVLAPIGLAHPIRSTINRLWVIAGLFGMCYMLNLPYVSELFRVVPLSLLRNNRSVLITGWSLLALGVTGLHAVWEKQVRWRTWFSWTACLLLVLALLCVFQRFRAQTMIAAGLTEANVKWFEYRYLESLLGCVTGVVLWLTLKWNRFPRRLLNTGIAALVLAELIWNAYGVSPQCHPSLYYPEIPALTALEHAPAGRVCGVACLWPDLNMRHHLREIRGYDAADPAPMVRLLAAANPDWKPDPPHAITMSFQPVESPILDMLNLRYRVHRGTPPEGHPVWLAQNGYWIEENPRALPRVFVPATVEVVSSDDVALDRMSHNDFNPREVAYVSSKNDIADAGRSFENSRSSGTAEIVNEHSSLVRIALDMQTSGMVVLSDRWSPGWKAFLDGQPVPILKANYALRGVDVPAGKATLEFRYQPFSFTLGLWCLEFAAGILLILAVILMRRGKGEEVNCGRG